MKIKPEFKLRTMGGTNVVITTANMSFQGVITINETGAFLWKIIENGAERDEMIHSLAEKCNVSEEEIISDVDEFIHSLEEADIIEQ